jgi:hypothetical protein
VLTMSQKVPQKRYSLFVLAIFLLLLGGAALFMGSHNFTIRSLGLAAVIAAMYFARISNVRSRSAVAVTSGQATKRPGYLMWIVGFALLLLAGGSYLLMYIDALHGGHTGWPAYLFAGVGIACAGVWGYIASKLV